MAEKRIAVFANKWWEADPLCAVLIHDKARPGAYTAFKYLTYPAPRAVKPPAGARPQNPPSDPRLTCECAGAQVEIWCVEELMNPAEPSSSSLEKSRVLKGAFKKRGVPDLVVAFGTAGSADTNVTLNGSVVIGRKVFVHDAFGDRADRSGLWQPTSPDAVVDSTLPGGFLNKLDQEARPSAEARMLTSPIDPGIPPRVLIGNSLVSVGVVNVTDYGDYTWADAEALDAFGHLEHPGRAASVETTHGVIRDSSTAPFLYVSGISDSEGLFDCQVTPREYAQNFVAAHNAALALVWLLPSMVTSLP